MDIQSLPKPKLLKSCIRCRKHKIKCDAFDKNPNPCSSCLKKKIQCKIDYVLPPQRSDNLKDLINQVSYLKFQINKLNTHYSTLSKNLNLNLPNYEKWKLVNDIEENNLNLIKLSNDCFISLNLTKDYLIINENYINLAELNSNLQKLKNKLKTFFDLFNVDLSVFEFEFDIERLFDSNKFNLLVLTKFLYPNLNFNFNIFLDSYLSSYYSITNQLNINSNSSTYSSNLNFLLNNNSSIFNKSKLSNLINSEIFNSEVFLKKLINLFFLNHLLNNDLNNDLFNLIKFVKQTINNNRKKLNFDKNLNLKFIENFLNFLNFKNTSIELFQSLNQLYKNLLTPYLNNIFLKNWFVFNNYLLNSITSNSLSFFDSFLIEFFAISLKSLSLNSNKETSLIYYNLLSLLESSNKNLQNLRNLLINNSNDYFFLNLKLNDIYLSIIDEDTSSSISSIGSISPVLNNLEMINYDYNKSFKISKPSKQKSLTFNNDELIQNILENVDWKRESTDDVLKKIGVTI